MEKEKKSYPEHKNAGDLVNPNAPVDGKDQAAGKKQYPEKDDGIKKPV
jgi:hypothetical protein